MLLVDGEEQPLGAFGMPRLETLRANDARRLPQRLLGPGADRARRPSSWRCARRLGGGAVEEAPLATIPAAAPVEPLPGRAASVAICMATCDPPLALFRAPDRVDPRADASRLGLRDQRRLLAARALRRRSRRCSATTRASWSRARRAGSASTATSSARWRWRPPGRSYVALADQDDAWHPDKLATLLAELGDAQLVYSDARVVDGDGRVLADSYWGRAQQQPHATCSRCWWRTRSPAPPRCFPALAAATTRCRSRPRSSRTSTTTGSRSWRSRSATSRSSSGRCTTTSSTAARRSGTPPRTACRGCASGSRRCAATRASGSGCGACTTSSTSAGCCSSRRSCGCGCGRGWRRASGGRSSASSAPTARSPRWRG